jgi:Uncharacterized protein conserved in bacteria (DUF2252)
MNIQQATQEYEIWLAKHLTLIDGDLTLKHTHMTEDPFSFFRATFYRWVQLWMERQSDFIKAPLVLAVGDLHVENFGTWRDIEGRLIWGVNDFDEAAWMPHTLDLVRLATSARLAIKLGHLTITSKEAADALLQGYRESLEATGSAFVLAEHHKGLREMAMSNLRDAERFWAKMEALPLALPPVPKAAVTALESMLPEPGLSYILSHRIAGLGSLGRQRYTALADWRGGKVAREAKALAPSAYCWQQTGNTSNEIQYQTILNNAVRCFDPTVRLIDGWIIRRLAPDCSRIDLSSLSKQGDMTRLLHAMGWETANVHLGSRQATEQVKHDLKQRPSDWLYLAAKEMADLVTTDWNDWKTGVAPSTKK